MIRLNFLPSFVHLEKRPERQSPSRCDPGMRRVMVACTHAPVGWLASNVRPGDYSYSFVEMTREVWRSTPGPSREPLALVVFTGVCPNCGHGYFDCYSADPNELG